MSGCSPYRGYGGSGVDEVAALRGELERHRVVVASIPALERDNRALRARLEHLRKVEKSLGKSRP